MWSKLTNWWYKQISDESKPLVVFASWFKTDCWVCMFYRGMAVPIAAYVVVKFFSWILF